MPIYTFTVPHTVPHTCVQMLVDGGGCVYKDAGRDVGSLLVCDIPETSVYRRLLAVKRVGCTFRWFVCSRELGGGDRGRVVRREVALSVAQLPHVFLELVAQGDIPRAGPTVRPHWDYVLHVDGRVHQARVVPVEIDLDRVLALVPAVPRVRGAHPAVHELRLVRRQQSAPRQVWNRMERAYVHLRLFTVLRHHVLVHP